MSDVSPEEVRQMLEQLAQRLEQGDMDSVTIKVMTDEGEVEHTISAKTEEERAEAIASIRQVLGTLH